MELHLADLRDDYVALVHRVAEEGDYVAPRGQPTREIRNVTLIFEDPTAPMLPVGVGRKVNLALAAAETAHLIAGVSDAEQLRRIAPIFERFTNKDRLLGAYGPRLRDQIPLVIESLTSDEVGRQGIATIWRPDELENPNSDMPCTLELHWMIRDSKLQMFTNMRSNDVWLGTPYDVNMFTRLQSTLAWALGIEVGTYVHHTSSLHIYERDLQFIDELHDSDYDDDPLPAFHTDLHDTAPGERSTNTALERWRRARHWAKVSALALPSREILPVGVEWYSQQLAKYQSEGLYCSHCYYVLPRTAEHYWSHCRSNKWKSRCRRCVTTFTRPQYDAQKFAKRCAKYGVTPEWYEQQLITQDNKCFICEREPDNGRYRDFVIDHDHLTGQVRGLLCNNCNHAIGLLSDDATRAERLGAYLRQANTEEQE